MTELCTVLWISERPGSTAAERVRREPWAACAVGPDGRIDAAYD